MNDMATTKKNAENKKKDAHTHIALQYNRFQKKSSFVLADFVYIIPYFIFVQCVFNVR